MTRIDEDEAFVLELNCFFDLTGFQAFYAYLDSPGGTVAQYGSDDLQVRKEPAGSNARDLLADAAFTLGKAATLYGSSGNRFFTAYFTDLRHY
jgi:hypothetical protein